MCPNIIPNNNTTPKIIPLFVKLKLFNMSGIIILKNCFFLLKVKKINLIFLKGAFL